MNSLTATNVDITDFLLYKDFIEEKNEILKHKWIEREKKGYDIGFNSALCEWILKYRTPWRRQKSRNLNNRGDY